MNKSEAIRLSLYMYFLFKGFLNSSLSETSLVGTGFLFRISVITPKKIEKRKRVLKVYLEKKNVCAFLLSFFFYN